MLVTALVCLLARFDLHARVGRAVSLQVQLEVLREATLESPTTLHYVHFEWVAWLLGATLVDRTRKTYACRLQLDS
jgi:hypothetical protein